MTTWSRRLAVVVVRGYQVLVSPLLPPACRFVPSCSDYACAALQSHGVLRGGWLVVKRIGRCHPWGTGGYDPPPAPPRPEQGWAR